jgi:ABC-type multidrug transport system fused ATPase/permease subunit
LFRISRVNPAGALMPAGLSFLAALSEGTGMLLLILIARGLGRMDYRLVERNPFVSSVVSKLTSDPDKRTLLIFLGLITALLMFITLKNILFYLSSIAAVRFTGKFGQGLTSSIFNRYMDFGKLFFDRVNAGRLHATLNAVNPLARQLETLNKHIAVLFMFLIYLIVLSRISWPLTLAVIFIIPVVNSLIKKRFKSTPHFRNTFKVLTI